MPIYGATVTGNKCNADITLRDHDHELVRCGKVSGHRDEHSGLLGQDDFVTWTDGSTTPEEHQPVLVSDTEIVRLLLHLRASATHARREADGAVSMAAAALRGKATGYRLAADQVESMLRRARKEADGE